MFRIFLSSAFASASFCRNPHTSLFLEDCCRRLESIIRCLTLDFSLRRSCVELPPIESSHLYVAAHSLHKLVWGLDFGVWTVLCNELCWPISVLDSDVQASRSTPPTLVPYEHVGHDLCGRGMGTTGSAWSRLTFLRVTHMTFPLDTL